MGKYNKKRLVVLIFSVVVLCISFISPSLRIKADNSSLLVNMYRVNAELTGSGDMKVVESVDFTFGGSFNGVNKEILFPEGTTIESLAVNEGGRDYKEVSSAVKGDSGVFRVEQKSDGDKLLWIYQPSSNMNRSFQISYIIKNAAKRYNDTGELYWKFIGNQNNTPIASVAINITLPSGSKRENIKLFAHGPLTGNSSILDDRNVNLSITNLPAGRYVEARVIFPISLIPGAQRIYKEDALSRILDEEAALADQANQEREQAREEVKSPDFNNTPNYDNNQDYNNVPNYQGRPNYNNSSSMDSAGFILVVLIIGGIGLLVYLKSKYGRDPEPDFHEQYYRELPEDYGPAVMSVLYYGNTSYKDVTATLMNLIRKRQLKLEASNIKKKRLFWAKEETDYIIYKLNNSISSLMEHEKYLMDWLLNDFGDGKSFSFSEIKDSNKTRRAAVEFRNKYNEWSSLVKQESQAFNFYEYSSVLSFKHRTQYGSNQYARWKAFKNFLQDFSNLKSAEPPSLVLWEHFLVYAISLGVAERVLQQLKIAIREEDFDYYYNSTNANMLTFLYFSQYNHYDGNIFDQFENITSYFEEITDSAMSIANSSNSSSSGDGGGFSGGGFGGGDGGGFSGGGDGGGGFGGF